MRPGPDPLHTDPPRGAVKKRRRGGKPSVGRAAGELVVVLAGMVGIVALVPLTSPWFVAATAAAGAVAAGYALHGVARRPGAAKWWGFVWGGSDDEGLALGLYRSGVLFAVALVPVVAVKALVRTPAVPHPLPYFAWCFVQDFLFFSLVLKNLARLTAGSIAWHRHFAVWGTAVLFGLSHFPLAGFMAVTAVVAVFWGYIFVQCRLLWPVTLSHFALGLMVML